MTSSEPAIDTARVVPKNQLGARYVIARVDGRAMSPTGDRRLTREQTARKEPCR